MEGWCSGSGRGGDSICGESRSHSKPVCGAEPEKAARRIAAPRLTLSATYNLKLFNLKLSSSGVATKAELVVSGQ